MQKDLGNYRKSYEKSALIEASVPEDPLDLFRSWFSETEAAQGVEEPNAMTLTTIGLDGFPRARVVLLKEFSQDGFVFYTNYQSAKGLAIAADPRVCLSFFWPKLERQVIIKGMASKISASQSDVYFDSRPEGSKLGAIVSDQSTVIDSREILESALTEAREKYKNKEIKRPDHWGGYVVMPLSIEFWQGRQNRLHDRIHYRLENHLDWKMERLAP